MKIKKKKLMIAIKILKRKIWKRKVIILWIIKKIIINKKDGNKQQSMSEKELNNKNEQSIQSFNTECSKIQVIQKKKKI